MGGLYSITTRATGTVLTAAIYNADHQNHVDNQTPQMTDDYSSSVGQMQSVSDPGGVGTESLPTSLAGEIERLRFALKNMHGGAQWYASKALAARAPTVATISGNTTLTVSNIDSLQNVTSTADITLPDVATLATGDRIRFKSSTEKKVQLLRQGTDTIDGATSYLVPSYTTVEVMKSGAGTYILSQRPGDNVGDIKLFGGSTAPLGWILHTAGNQNRVNQGGLFAVYGTTHGAGDGSTTFGIPNMSRRVPVGAGGSGTGTLGNALGNTGGEETHLLTGAESGLQDHAHSASSSGSGQVYTGGAVGGNTVLLDGTSSPLQNGTGSLANPRGSLALSISTTVNNSGAANAGAAHNNMQPSYVLNYIIKT